LWVFDKRKQTRQSKETKKNNNKVGSERLPLHKSSFSLATAPKNSLDVSQDPLGNPKRKV
jgi:hypothetical protein